MQSANLAAAKSAVVALLLLQVVAALDGYSKFSP
jgi:hypothetical protein